MTKQFDDFELAGELHELLVAAALCDATDSQLARLNDLLSRDSRLRHQAARFFEEEAVLRRQFNVIDRVGEFHRPLATDLLGAESALDETRLHCEAAILNSLPRRFLVAAAILIVTSLAVFGWQAGGGVRKNVGLTNARQETSLKPRGANGPEDGKPRSPSVPLAATILTPVTHVSWSGPQFAPQGKTDLPTAIIREGVTSFVSAFGRPAEGYMVCLQPGALLDLVVAGDAEGENALAVIEFEANGRPTGQRISFTNSAGKNARSSIVAGQQIVATKKGRLGVWTARNESETPRYYLFTGVHKLLNRSADDSWHVSRLTAFVEEPGLMHIGWDDSGMPDNGDKELVQFPDFDFDDVTATIRIRNAGEDPISPPADVRVFSKVNLRSDDRDRRLTSDAGRYQFSVGPGHTAIIKVCSRSNTSVEVAVFEKETGTVKWRCLKSKSRTPTLGICAIENRTAKASEYYLAGRRMQQSIEGSAAESSLAVAVLSEQEEFVTVGFYDDKLKSDFDKVRVDVLTVDRL